MSKAYTSNFRSSAADAIAVPTGAATGKQEPHALTEVTWSVEDKRWKLMKMQFYTLVGPIILSGMILFADFIMAALEMNGKRLWTVDNYLYWRISVAFIHVMVAIWVGVWTYKGIRTKSGTNVYDHKHYSSFRSYVFVVVIATLTTYGLQQTFYSYATQAQIDEWNNFSVSRYEGVSLTYQRVESRMLVLYTAVLLSALLACAMSANVFDAWMFPAPSKAVLANTYMEKTSGKSRPPAAVDEPGSDDE